MNAIYKVNCIHYHGGMSTETTPGSTRRQREREEIRRRVFDAARALFAERGYDAVTMQQVAAALDYTPGALYRHFPGKEALVRALVAEDFGAFFAAFGHVAAITDPVRRIRASGEAYVEFGLSHPHHYRLLFMTPHAVAEEASPPGPEVGAYRMMRDAVAEAIAGGLLRPEHRDAEAVAQALWASVHGIVSLAISMAGANWLDWRPTRPTHRLLADALLVGLVRADHPLLAEIAGADTERSDG